MMQYTSRMDTSWATRPLFTFSPTARFAAMVIGVATFVLLIISPALFMLGWQVHYGSTIQTRGKKVSVPLRWVAETRFKNIWIS